MRNLPHRSHGIGDPGSRTRLFNYQAFAFSETNTDLYTHFMYKYVWKKHLWKSALVQVLFPYSSQLDNLLFCSSVMLVFFICSFSHLFSMRPTVFSVDSPARLTQYFHVVNTSDKEVLVFSQYLLFSFGKEAAMDKWGKGDSLSFCFL